MLNIISKILLITLTIVMTGCLIVKHPDTGDVSPTMSLSPKPEMEMQGDPIRSKDGDMIAFLPKDWFLIDANKEASSDIIAIAVNPDYTLSAVFKNIRRNSLIDKTVEKESLLGLARFSFSHRQRKTGNAAKQIGKYTPIEMGTNKFVSYQYSVSGGALNASVMVFKSSLNKYYEFALIPMEINGKMLPDKKTVDKIFRSISATIKF